jgi:hypothetical protein
MFGDLIGLATLPIDIVKDIATLGGSITDEESAVSKKLKYLSGYDKYKREQNRKDLELMLKYMTKMEGK